MEVKWIALHHVVKDDDTRNLYRPSNFIKNKDF